MKQNSNQSEINELLKDLKFEKGEQLADLFSEKAKSVAELLKKDYIYAYDKKTQERYKQNKETKITQFRKFYEKILELNEKAKGLNDEDFNIKIKPFVKMLNSKVQYAVTRNVAGENFKALMETSIKAVNSKDELQNFKYFLESIIGFMPKK